MEAYSLTRRAPLALPRSPRLLSALSDDKLVAQLRRGNEAAFEVIYDRHHRGLLSFSRHMLGSQEEAEDALQQTFISAHANLLGKDAEVNLKPWLYAIARNCCLSMLRARRAQPSDDIEIATAGLAEEVQQRADLRELLADMDELPEDQRSALVLSEIGDLSHAEVAGVVGCGESKVKSLVFQARSSLLEQKNARETSCTEIRQQLSTLTGGALRRGPLRRHLKGCEGCSEFRDQVKRQRAALAVLLPVAPSLGLKASALAAVGVGKGAAAGAAGLSGTAATATGTAAGGAGTAVGAVGGGSIVSGGTALGGGSAVGTAAATGAAKGGGGALAGVLAKAGATKVAVMTVAAVGGGAGVAVTAHEIEKGRQPVKVEQVAKQQPTSGSVAGESPAAALVGGTPPGSAGPVATGTGTERKAARRRARRVRHRTRRLRTRRRALRRVLSAPTTTPLEREDARRQLRQQAAALRPGRRLALGHAKPNGVRQGPQQNAGAEGKAKAKAKRKRSQRHQNGEGGQQNTGRERKARAKARVRQKQQSQQQEQAQLRQQAQQKQAQQRQQQQARLRQQAQLRRQRAEERRRRRRQQQQALAPTTP